MNHPVQLLDEETLQRFWSKVNKDAPNGCWEWRSASGGYGHFRVNGKNRPAHRVSYEQEVGPIPEGLVIDHVCDNPPCVNPAHLRPASHRENILRGTGVAAHHLAKTHCPKGHPYEGDNVYHEPNGWRRCRQCNRERHRKMDRSGRKPPKRKKNSDEVNHVS